MQDTHRSQDESGDDAREHEREAQRREAEERPPAERAEPDEDDKPAPPGTVNQPRG
jgi:hypothetical protein